MELETNMRSVGEAVRPAIAGAMALAERWRTDAAWNPLSDRTVQDPYPVYAAPRTRSPVHRSTLLNAWVFTRHADVDATLDLDDALSIGDKLNRRLGYDREAWTAMAAASMYAEDDDPEGGAWH